MRFENMIHLTISQRSRLSVVGELLNFRLELKLNL